MSDLTASNMYIELGAAIEHPHFELIECKGKGHPDTLADDLAESLSNAYASYTREECGAVLHHNFDKLCILGGSCDVRYGSGVLTKPIRILVNGRASLTFAGRRLAIQELIEQTCQAFFLERFPDVPFSDAFVIEQNISTASSPGPVYSTESTGQRHHWFKPRTLEDLPETKRLFANDTSLGTGYAPLSVSETFVRDLAFRLSSRPSDTAPQWMGTDVKVMAASLDHAIDIVACVPQIANHVANRESYSANMLWLYQECQSFASKRLSDHVVSFTLNARDNPDTDELYLTAIGTSLESGDEGAVGRGNRLNGLITPMRPMNLEGVSGKNPVYHVGKLYNAMAADVARSLHEEYGGLVIVNLASATGTPLDRPWKVVVQMQSDTPSQQEVASHIEQLLQSFPRLTNRLISRDLNVGGYL